MEFFLNRSCKKEEISESVSDSSKFYKPNAEYAYGWEAENTCSQEDAETNPKRKEILPINGFILETPISSSQYL